MLEKKSLKLNFILHNLRLFLTFTVPLVTFPYITRILGPINIGKVDFANSIVNYFVLFATLGIPTYGIREISNHRNSQYGLTRTVAELSVIQLITTLFSVIFYIVLVLLVPKFSEQKLLFLIIAPNIIFSAFGYEWFYIGIEDQSYITIRFIIIKFIQVFLIFLLVKEQNDFLEYAVILISLNGISSFFNIYRLNKYIKFYKVIRIDLRKHIKPIILMFISVIAISIYNQLDITMVGILVGEREVGLYTTANKLIRIIISLVTSMGIVILPRLTNDLETGNLEGYKYHIKKSLSFILFLGFPLVLGLNIISDEFVFLLAGKEFSESSFSMRLLSPIILIVGLAQFVGFQILYSHKKEKFYTIAVTVAAIINFISNYLLIPIYKQNGAIIGTVIAEISGLIFMLVFAHKYIKEYEIINWRFIFYIIASCIMFLVMYVLKIFINNNIFFLVTIGIICYCCQIFLFNIYRITKLKQTKITINKIVDLFII